MDLLKVIVRPDSEQQHQVSRAAGGSTGRAKIPVAAAAPTNRSFVACDSDAGGVVKLIKFAALLHPESRHLVMHLERAREHDDAAAAAREAGQRATASAQPFGAPTRRAAGSGGGGGGAQATRPPTLPLGADDDGRDDNKIKVRTSGSLGVDTERDTSSYKNNTSTANGNRPSRTTTTVGGGVVVPNSPVDTRIAKRVSQPAESISRENNSSSQEQLDSNNNNNNNNNKDDDSKQQQQQQQNMVKYHKISLHLQSVDTPAGQVAQQLQEQEQREHSKGAGPPDAPDDHEPFEIVWRNLCFEVDQISYDQLLVHALVKFRRLFRLGGAPRGDRGHEREHDEVKQQQQQQQDSKKQQVPVGDHLATPPPPPLDSLGAATGARRRLIFENLNGYVRSGEVSAILGPSGAGKTSLLNAICGRTHNYRGSIRLLGGGRRRMRMSIIPQKDYLIENLTVRENLLYSSRILNYDAERREPAGRFDHEANIARVVRMLNLTACLHSSVANISGGEYKRVSIAQELLRQPDILVLDEPTSGLDSLNCKKLVQSLVQLIEASRRGLMNQIAIVMTIHQPDIDVFNMFDHVYCMARGGRVIYDGHPSGAMQTIRSNLLRGGQPTTTEPPATATATKPTPTTTTFATLSSLGDQAGLLREQPAAEIRSVGNPANLLIEIASEDIYGSEPVDRLARLQRKQFEQMYAGGGGGGGGGGGAHRGPPMDAEGTRQEQEQQQQRQHGQNKAADSRIELDELALAHLANDNESSGSSPDSGTTSSGSTASTSDLEDDSDRSKRRHKSSCLVRDKRLSARRKDQHRGRFWYHTGLLARRAFVSTLRDPLMTLISFLFHLSIPFVMWTVYPKQIGSVRACPLINRQLDLVSMASNRTSNAIEELQEQLTTSFECSTMFFLTTYSFSMCSLAVAALAFPLNMHVLLKEVRNGWYNLPAFVLGKTIASFPFEVLFPVVSLVLIYVMLDMPESYLEWRLWAIALVMVLVSMISTTLGLVFGSACMDSVQTAVFLAVASSLPQVILSGFTARIKNMPAFFQRASWLSPYRYSSDLINMIRFGFGLCPCDQTTEAYLRAQPAEFSDVPAHMKPLFAYYLSNSAPGAADPAELADNSTTTTTTTAQLLAGNATGAAPMVDNATHAQLLTSWPHAPMVPGVSHELLLTAGERAAMLARIEANEVDLFGEMASRMSRAFSFGRHIADCQSFRSQLLTTAGTPSDDHLPLLFGCMFALLVATKIILFVLVKLKIGSRI